MPSSLNLGPPKNLITGWKRFCRGLNISNPPNCAWAVLRQQRTRITVSAELVLETLILRLSRKDWSVLSGDKMMIT